MLIKCTCGSKSRTIRTRYPFKSTGRPISHHAGEKSAKNRPKRLSGGVMGTNIFGVLGAIIKFSFPLKAWH